MNFTDSLLCASELSPTPCLTKEDNEIDEHLGGQPL